MAVVRMAPGPLEDVTGWCRQGFERMATKALCDTVRLITPRAPQVASTCTYEQHGRTCVHAFALKRSKQLVKQYVILLHGQCPPCTSPSLLRSPGHARARGVASLASTATRPNER